MPRKISKLSSRYDADTTILDERLRIFCDNRDSSLSWPTQHELTFAAIHAISRVTWDNYKSDSVTFERSHQRHSIRQKAKLIAQTARHLASEVQNEQGWRLNLEHHIVDRFRSNIECKCKKRVWVCDFEPPLDHSDKTSTARIQAQRYTRKICTSSHKGDKFRKLGGTRPLVFDCSGVPVQHVTIDGLGNARQPDRVFGLRNTEYFSRLLAACAGDEPIEYSTLCKTTPLIFPFLLLESKSEGGGGFPGVYEQSAQPLQSFLQLQDKLQARAGVPNELNKSLVWFLAHRGRDWQVLAAYTNYDSEEGSAESVIVRVWEGNVTRKVKALQLLLAIDFIYDWARDVYHENLVAWLESARPDTAKLKDCKRDSDILSRSSNFSGGPLKQVSRHPLICDCDLISRPLETLSDLDTYPTTLSGSGDNSQTLCYFSNSLEILPRLDQHSENILDSTLVDSSSQLNISSEIESPREENLLDMGCFSSSENLSNDEYFTADESLSEFCPFTGQTLPQDNDSSSIENTSKADDTLDAESTFTDIEFSDDDTFLEGDSALKLEGSSNDKASLEGKHFLDVESPSRTSSHSSHLSGSLDEHFGYPKDSSSVSTVTFDPSKGPPLAKPIPKVKLPCPPDREITLNVHRHTQDATNASSNANEPSKAKIRGKPVPKVKLPGLPNQFKPLSSAQDTSSNANKSSKTTFRLKGKLPCLPNQVLTFKPPPSAQEILSNVNESSKTLLRVKRIPKGKLSNSQNRKSTSDINHPSQIVSRASSNKNCLLRVSPGADDVSKTLSSYHDHSVPLRDKCSFNFEHTLQLFSPPEGLSNDSFDASSGV